jgi:hypothetical protein
VSTYYVKNGGNDGNSGLSDLLAWATVSKVNGHTFAAGDSCLFKKGSTWNEALNPGQSGSAGSPITFGNYDTGVLPIFNNTGISIYLEQNYVTFDGLHAQGASYAAMRGTGTASHLIVKNSEASLSERGIEFGTNGSGPYTYIEIYDNELHHCTCHGLLFSYNGQHLKAYRNHIHDIDTDETGSGGDWTGPIKCFDSNNQMDDVEIYQNYLHTCGRSAATGSQTNAGIWIDALWWQGTPTVPTRIHHNYIADVTRDGIFLEISSSNHVWGNVIVNCGTSDVNGDSYFDSSGFRFDCRADGNTSDNLVYNNTIYGGRNGIFGVCYNESGGYGRMDDNLVKNNIVVGQTFRRLNLQNGPDNDTYGSGNVYEYNCFGAQATNFIRYGSDLSTYAAFDSAYGASTHSIQSDPKLTNPAAGDCTLQSDSPCINAGANLGATYKYGLMHDSVWPSGVVLGDQGNYGAGWEVGAYIYETATAWMTAQLAAGGS